MRIREKWKPEKNQWNNKLIFETINLINKSVDIFIKKKEISNNKNERGNIFTNPRDIKK